MSEATSIESVAATTQLSARERNRKHAEKVIQFQFEQHGAASRQFQSWLYHYLAFLLSRRLWARDFAEFNDNRSGDPIWNPTIQQAVYALKFADPDHKDYVVELWLKLKEKLLTFAPQIGTDGQPAPVFHYINSWFAKEMGTDTTLGKFEEKRVRSVEFAGFMDSSAQDAAEPSDGDFDPRPDPLYEYATDGSEERFSATLHSTSEEHDHPVWAGSHVPELREFMRGQWAMQAKSHGKIVERIAIASVMLEVGIDNAAEITRRLNAGEWTLASFDAHIKQMADDMTHAIQNSKDPYSDELVMARFDYHQRLIATREAMTKPLPIAIHVRTTQRRVDNYIAGIREIGERHAREKIQRAADALKKNGHSLKRDPSAPEVLQAELGRLLGNDAIEERNRSSRKQAELARRIARGLTKNPLPDESSALDGLAVSA